MTKLIGSEKQVAWAEKIREGKYSDLEKWLQKCTEKATVKMGAEKAEAKANEIRTAIHSIAKASDWIALRTSSVREIWHAIKIGLIEI